MIYLIIKSRSAIMIQQLNNRNKRSKSIIQQQTTKREKSKNLSVKLLSCKIESGNLKRLKDSNKRTLDCFKKIYNKKINKLLIFNIQSQLGEQKVQNKTNRLQIKTQ